MIKEAMDYLLACDPEVGRAVEQEYRRQQQNIELIASERYSPTSMPRVIPANGIMAAVNM